MNHPIKVGAAAGLGLALAGSVAMATLPWSATTSRFPSGVIARPAG